MDAVEIVQFVAKREINGFMSVVTEAEVYAGKHCRKLCIITFMRILVYRNSKSESNRIQDS